MKAADKTANGSGAERTAQAGGSRQPDTRSVAEDLWRRLDAMEVINQGMLFAATLGAVAGLVWQERSSGRSGRS